MIKCHPVEIQEIQNQRDRTSMEEDCAKRVADQTSPETETTFDQISSAVSQPLLLHCTTVQYGFPTAGGPKSETPEEPPNVPDFIWHLEASAPPM